MGGRKWLLGCLRSAASGLAGWCHSTRDLSLVGHSKWKDRAGVTSSTPFTVVILFYRDLSTGMTARVSTLSTPTATGKAESSSVPGISITCMYKVLIQTCLHRALHLRQERYRHWVFAPPPPSLQLAPLQILHCDKRCLDAAAVSDNIKSWRQIIMPSLVSCFASVQIFFVWKHTPPHHIIFCEGFSLVKTHFQALWACEANGIC